MTIEESPPVAPSVLELCEEVVLGWKEIHYPGVDFTREVTMLASRARSWVSTKSVLAGVSDVFAGTRVSGESLPPEVVSVLADDLARTLQAHNILVAQPRRAGLLA